MKKILLFNLILFFVCVKSFAQLDSQHYLPPLKQTSGTNNTATHQSNAAIFQQAIYLSIPETAGFVVNVYRGVSAVSWLVIPNLVNGTPFIIDNVDDLADKNKVTIKS